MKIQVVQLAEVIPVRVRQCKINVVRVVTHCGMHSHASVMKGGLAEYLYETSRESCDKIINTGVLVMGNGIIVDGLRKNEHHSRAITLSGRIDSDGKCSGSTYSDMFGSWDNAVVQATLNIHLVEYKTHAKIQDNEIHLRSGLTCKYSEGFCMDNEAGYTLWDHNPPRMCAPDQYIVHMEGVARKYVKEIDTVNGKKKVTSYFLETEEKIVWLGAEGKTRVCNLDAWKTEHPRVLIIEEPEGGFIFTSRRLDTKDMDLFLYMNAKFITYDKHMGSQLTQLNNHINYQRCLLESQMLQSLMSTAYIDPVMFARDYMKEPGYTGFRRNEVIYIIKCQAVDVSWRQEIDHCYDEVPVIYNNQSLFMSPRTRILQPYGTEISCNRIFVGGFQFGSEWYTFNPSRQYVSPPEDIMITNRTVWQYTEARGIHTKGLYSDEELRRLSNDISYHSTRDAIQNNIARSVLGLDPDTQGISLINAFSKKDLESLSKKIWKNTWNVFTTVGEAVNGMVGFYAIWVGLKYCFNVLMNGVSLYRVFGCGKELVGSLCSGMTHALVVHETVKKDPKEIKQPDHEENHTMIDIQPIPTCPSVYPTLNDNNAPRI